MCKIVEADNHFFDSKTSVDFILDRLNNTNIKPGDLTKRDVYITTVKNKKVKCEFINFPSGCIVVGLIGLNRTFMMSNAGNDIIISHNDELGIIPNSPIALRSMVASNNTKSAKVIGHNKEDLEKYILNVLCK